LASGPQPVKNTTKVKDTTVKAISSLLNITLSF
jgi:hypothetical protein